MKTFACVLLLAAVVAAEPPRYRPAYDRFRYARQEVQGQEPTTARTDDAPYPAAGFRPATEFKLPTRENPAPPATLYGVPENSYGPPALEYGPPESATTAEPEQKDDSENVTVEGLTKGKLEEAPKKDAEVVSNQGAYYVLLPDSQLQRVQFQTENDLRNMAYTARLQYKDEDRAPLYVYTAQYQPAAAYVQASQAYYQPSAALLQPSVTYGKPSAAYVQFF